MKFAVGQKVGHFKILRRYEIEPTMETYIAEDLVLGREVLFTTHASATEKSKHALSDLQTTVRAIATLSHPNLVPILEVFDTDGRLVVISETMDGTRLDTLIEKGALSLNEALDLAIQICSGLSAAHRAGIAHGSISATAVSVDHESRAQLAAFVRARLRILGGAESPAEKSGGTISKEKDIQDLGQLLRLMLDRQITDSDDEDQPILIDTITISTASLRKVIRKALSKPEKAGYRTVDELLEDLRRARAEMSLHRGDDQLKEVFEDAVIGLYRTTPDGRVVLVNRSLLRMMGFDSIEELASLDLNKSGYAKGYSRAEYIERMERDGAVTGLESAWLAKDGRPVYIRESGRVIKDRTGRVLYYEGTVENISERKHIEEAYRTLVDHSLQGLLILQDGRVVFANETFARMVGYSVEELLGFDADKSSEILAPGQREMVLQRIQDRLSGKPVPDKYEFSGRRKDGSVFWMEVYASLTQYAGKPAIQGAFVDITERKLAEEALEYRIEFKQLITNISSDFINLRSDEIDQGIYNALEAIGKFAEVDRTHLLLLSDDGRTLNNTHEWCNEGIEPRAPEYRKIDLGTMPWAFERLSQFENISVASPDALPADASNERAAMEAIGTRSYIAVPLRL
ncbi:MAG: PAS domain S-box protein, partial [Candidatus Zixiibacteriota bacterium]